MFDNTRTPRAGPFNLDWVLPAQGPFHAHLRPRETEANHATRIVSTNELLSSSSPSPSSSRIISHSDSRRRGASGRNRNRFLSLPSARNQIRVFLHCGGFIFLRRGLPGKMEFGIRRKPLSLVELCVRRVIDNLRYVGSVDGVEMELLKRILPHCTQEQLTRIESRTQMDLSSITDPLWKLFYQRQFGEEHTKDVISRMKKYPNKRFTWKDLFRVKTEKQKEKEDMMVERFTQKFQAEKAEKQSKQIKLCTKVPPSSKRSFYAGGGPSYLSNSSYKSPILKKARMEVDSRARLQTAIQKNSLARSSQQTRTSSLNGNSMRTTTIHRPNSTITITKPAGTGTIKQIQNSRSKF